MKKVVIKDPAALREFFMMLIDEMVFQDIHHSKEVADALREQVNVVFFEEPVERWRPKLMEKVFIVSACGDIEAHYWNNEVFDEGFLELGNVFPTKQDAEEHRSWLIDQAKKREEV